MKSFAGLAGTFVAVLAAIVLAELPPLIAIAAWIDARELHLLIVVAVVLALGFGLFLGGIVKLLMDRGHDLSHAEVEDVEASVRMAGRPVAWRASHYRVFGAAAGRGGSESFQLGDLKAAWRSGALLRDSEWRRRTVTMAGALCLVTGVFGIGVVIGPPWIKVLLAGALLYAFARLVWGLRQSDVGSRP